MARRSKKSLLYRIARVDERFWGRRGEVKNRDILDENGAFLRQSAGFCPVRRGFWGDGGRRAPKSGTRKRAEVQKALFSHHKSLSGAKFRKSTLGLSEKKYYLCPTDARASQTQGSGARSERTARSSPFMVTDHAPPPCAQRAAAASGMARRLRRNLPPTRTS